MGPAYFFALFGQEGVGSEAGTPNREEFWGVALLHASLGRDLGF